MAALRSEVGRGGVRPLVVAAVLALFALTGLGAGITTGATIGRLRLGLSSSTPPATSTGGEPSPSPSPSPTATITLYAGAFTLDAVVAPNPVASGQHLTVRVTTTGQDGSGAAAGVRCTLEDTTGASLLPGTVASVTTDAGGRASWDFVVPQGAAGSHSLKVLGVGAHNNSYYVIRTITVTG